MTSPAVLPIFTPPRKLWVPRRVLLTPAAREWAHGLAMVDRLAALGADVTELRTNRLTGLSDAAYAEAKTTLAIVTAPPSKRRPQPIPPSADWQFHLAEGCPAHCQYCYLAGSLAGPPLTKAYANLPEILADLRPCLGQGTITSQSASRAAEGTTFEASCYTDPLGIEHITGSLAETIRFFGTWDAPVQLRWTTKFADVSGLLDLPHHGRTRVRFSVNAPAVVRLWEGGTANLPSRLSALGRMARAGYPVGLTVAPIMPIPDWQDQYRRLFQAAARELVGVSGLDLTVELITHRFTPGSKAVLQNWYPKTTLDLDETRRAEKRTKFGSLKYVYPKDQMRELRSWFESAVVEELPAPRMLYWT